VQQWLIGSGLRLSTAQRALHAHVIGQPGMGKSSLLLSWIIQDIVAGHGVIVLDPHGDLYDNVVLWLAMLREHLPQLAERLILLDPNEPTWTVGFNPLQPIEGISLQRLAWFLTDVIMKIWKMDATSYPRMLRLITYSFQTLAEFDLNLLDLPRFLNDTNWRESLISKTVHADARDYFRHEFPSKQGGIHQWVVPVLNKIGPLVFDPDVRLMLGGRSTINFRKILDDNSILLVNLSKGILGEGNSAMLGAFIVAHVQQAAMSRADTFLRKQVFFYLDEFQNYTTDNIKDILSESRKYGLSLILAHQYLDQLTTDLRGAVMNTAGTMVCMRLGYHDASIISREMFPPGDLRQSRQEVGFKTIAKFPVPFFEEQSEPLKHEALVTLLTQLRPREFWTKRRGPEMPIKQRALNLPAVEPTPELMAARKQLIDLSGNRFGRLKAEVREELKNGRTQVDDDSTTTFYEAR
jgi:hypothetical protein